MRTKQQDRERKEQERTEGRMVETVHPSKASLLRRSKLEKSLQLWSCYYLNEIFYDECGQIHIDAFNELQYRIEHGGRKAKCMPRSSGKSAIGEAGCAWGALTGKRKFIVPIGSTADNAQSYHDFMVNLLTENERIAEDYPEICTFFQDLDGSAHKARYQLFEDGEATGIKLKPRLIVLPNAKDQKGKPYPHAQCVIMIKSIDSRVRGAKYTLLDGREVRPDFVLLDDIQDEETAASDVLSEKMEKKVVGAVLGLAGHRKKIACYFPCTIQREGDVSWRFLDRKKHPDFSGDNIPMIQVWPEDFTEKRGLWEEYEAIWRSDIEESEKHEKLNAFLKANYEAMHKGAKVSWESRIRDGEISAVQTAMNHYYEYGDEFFSEYQGEPIRQGVEVCSITPEMVLRRVTTRNAFELPEWSDSIFTATDINPSKALTTVMYAYGADSSSACLWYGQYTGAPLPTNNDMSDSQKDKIIFGALWKQGEQLLTFPVRGKQWGVDGAGTNSNVCTRFAYEWNRAHPEMPCVVTYGRDSQRALGSPNNKLVRRRGPDNSWLLKRDRDPSFGWIDWILWNADYWRDFMIRTWTCETNAPGGSTLPKGNHRTFANHICSKTLAWKGDQNGVTGYRWKISSPEDHYADASNMCHVLADMNGIGSGNTKKQKSEFVAPIFRPSIRR
jgi:hypothetical protein